MENVPASPSDLTIRKARAGDGEIIGQYGADLMALHHGWDAKRFMAPGPSTPQKYAGYLTSQLGRKDAVVLVAEAGGRVIGYSYSGNEGHDYMALRGPAGVIHDIFVEEKWRGCGVGLRLLDATIAELTGLGASQIVLSTAYLNEAGKRLFQSAGLRPTMVEYTL